MNGMNHIDAYMYAWPHAKNQLHTSDHPWDVALNHFENIWPHQLETTEINFNFYGRKPHPKNQLHNSTHSWYEADLPFDISLGMPKPVWQYLVEMTK